MLLKTSKEEKVTYSLICILCFCLGGTVPLGAFGTFGACKIFSQKKINKGIKTALITSFILLQKFILLQARTF